MDSNFDDMLTIENVCIACESNEKPCAEPCEKWYKLLENNTL